VGVGVCDVVKVVGNVHDGDD